MEFQTLDALRKKQPGVAPARGRQRTLRGQLPAPKFRRAHVRTISQHDLVARLDDYYSTYAKGLGDRRISPQRHRLSRRVGGRGSRLGAQVLSPDSDEPHFDLTPATEKALAWLASLHQRQFVGTESPPDTVF